MPPGQAWWGREADLVRVSVTRPSLGYEPYDIRLCRLGQSPVTALVSADVRHELVPDLLRLPCLSPSRRVSCTNACTNQLPGLLISVGQHDRPSGTQRTREHLIRRSGQVVQDRPSPVVGWAHIPELSTCVGRCPAAWQQRWQQSRRNGADPRPSAFQAGHMPSWRGSCERYALSPVAAACRWSLLLLSPLLSTRRRPSGSKPTRTVQGMARVRSGQAPAWPLVSGRSVRRGSGVKRDFACTFTRHVSPVLVVLRSQSRLRLEGRARTLSGPSPDLSPARILAPSARCRVVFHGSRLPGCWAGYWWCGGGS